SNTLAATILAGTCAKADAYATAFMAMDLADALKLLTSQRELEAYLIYLDENGETQEYMTQGFKELVIEN
ncbi:MAG: FAD:protein FMN transferase, partial [Pricia sp.]|nr:FAD:protein FMN transferase [Pricia sp.]